MVLGLPRRTCAVAGAALYGVGRALAGSTAAGIWAVASPIRAVFCAGQITADVRAIFSVGAVAPNVGAFEGIDEPAAVAANLWCFGV